MKESRHANFGAIQAIFLQLSWSHHKLAHSRESARERERARARERERERENPPRGYVIII